MKEMLIETLRYLIPAIIGFAFGILATIISQNLDKDEKSASIAKLLFAEVHSEILPTIEVTYGVVKNIEAKKFELELSYFSNIYSPNSEITHFNDIGLLNSSIIEKYVSYKQIIKVCAQYRETVVSAIFNNREKIPTHYYTYLIGLDAVVKRGINLLYELKQNYKLDDFSELPEYKIIDFNRLLPFIGAISKDGLK